MRELRRELPVGLHTSDPWFARVDVGGLSDDSRRSILQKVKDRLGFGRTLEALGIARGSLYNYPKLWQI